MPTLQGKHLVAEIFADIFSITRSDKILKFSKKPSLFKTKVLMDVTYNKNNLGGLRFKNKIMLSMLSC
jgi:hypothetical protein